MSKTYAPYNFVPFAEQPLRRYESAEKLPAHGRWYPELLSGEIRLRITAQTLIYIGNGEKEDNQVDFFHTASGQYAIPGSTLRGLIRENMQILGFGLLRPGEDFQNYRIIYRKMADAKGTLGRNLKDLYEDRLGVKNSPPRKVHGGFLYCDAPHRYHIEPVSTVYAVKKSLQENAAWRDLTACDRPIYYKAKGTTKLGDPTAVLSATPQDGYEKGVLHCVGRMNKQNTLYVFPEPEEDAELIPLSDEDIFAYAEDYEARKNSLGGTGQAKMFWALPEPKQRKPVFFLQRGSSTDFGMSRYLRIAYDNSIEQGLPEAQQRAAKEALFLDYPYAILGFTANSESYRSRVQFEDLTAEDDPRKGDLFHMQLGEPKLSFYPGYAKDGKHYNTPGFQFNGLKQYWLKPSQKQAVPASSFTSPMRPLPEGTEFTGSVRYHNLHPDELGLLLWCLILEKNCMQNIGRGKPYGYGRVSISVEELREFDPNALYGAGKLLCAPAALGNPQDRIEKLISTYKNTLRDEHGIIAEDSPTIQDFLYMKKTVQPDSLAFSYMSLKEFQNIRQPLPSAGDYRTGQVQPDAAAPYHGTQQSGQRSREPKPYTAGGTPGAAPKPGSFVEGCVSKILDSGFFVKLDGGGSGFVPAKEIAFHFVEKGTVGDYVQIGQRVRVKVLDPYNGKTSLSLQQAKY